MRDVLKRGLTGKCDRDDRAPLDAAEIFESAAALGVRSSIALAPIPAIDLCHFGRMRGVRDARALIRGRIFAREWGVKDILRHDLAATYSRSLHMAAAIPTAWRE